VIGYLTLWRRNYFFFLILAHPVYKIWIIQKPNKLALWNKLHFEEKKNGEYGICLKYSVPIFVEYKMQRLEVSGAVWPIHGSLGVKRLMNNKFKHFRKAAAVARWRWPSVFCLVVMKKLDLRQSMFQARFEANTSYSTSIRSGKFSHKHNYEYMAKWWCLLAIENKQESCQNLMMAAKGRNM